MRHTAVTRLALSGADFKTIQEFSGHESLQMVLRYAHAQDDAINKALDRLETTSEPQKAKKRGDRLRTATPELHQSKKTAQVRPSRLLTSR
jgi:hypothetical protein